MLQLKNIYKSYTTGRYKQIALDGINLKFRDSEFVAILGPCGSGKTTFLNIIGGLDRCDKGDLIINTKSTKNFCETDWDFYRNNMVSFIFKDYNLIPHLSILENVQMGISLINLSKKEKKQKALDALEMVGLKDYIRKSSDRLSKDEMQRVAIARAIVSEADIILADEITGNLDSQSSLEIMDLMKKVFKDKLVIVVTQDQYIAKAYANRIINFRDGEVIYDSNPLNDDLYEKDIHLKKTKMDFCTCLKIVIRDISNKKLRTFFTIIVSSVGVLLIAVVMAFLNGFSQKLNSYESNTLSNFPIIINKSSNNLILNNEEESTLKFDMDQLKSYTSEESVYPYNEDDINHRNNITGEYVDYIQEMDKNLFSVILYEDSVNMNILSKTQSNDVTILDNYSMNFVDYSKTDNEPNYLERNYDLLYGYYPTTKEDAVLIVDEYNRIDENTLDFLGVNYEDEQPVEFDKLVGTQFKLILNNDFYIKKDDRFYIDTTQSHLNELYNSKNAVNIKITGIIRAKTNKNLLLLSEGLIYNMDLLNFYVNNCKHSDIVKAQMDKDYNIINKQKFIQRRQNDYLYGDNFKKNINTSETKEDMISALGASFITSSITIYPNDFDSKNEIAKYLNMYNISKKQEESIFYLDTSQVVSELSSNIIKFISVVVFMFATIHVLISIIIIFILTYASTLERNREICVLRVLGARRCDIVKLFNTQNILIGFISGIVGIFEANIIILFLNHILENTIKLSNVAFLRPWQFVLLIVVSIAMMFIGGLIPAKIAAKSNPIKILKNL